MITGTLLGGPAPRVVLSYGLGVDSTALLLRWLVDPGSRDFDLDELLVVTAMTGDEWPATGRLVAQHVLPLLAAHQVRYLQVARAGASQRDGVVVLDDSRRPGRLWLDGAYRLSQEMLAAGTVPQVGGVRKCSAKAKGWPLDTVLAEVTGGAPFRHVLGFEAGEGRRAVRDAAHNTPARTGEYPLIDWGWDRATCQAWITEQLGVAWPKSACVYCPFALATHAGRARTIPRFVDDPDAGVLALVMEYTATALNPAQGLIGGDRLLPLLRNTPDGAVVVDRFDRELRERTWAVYDVRRAFRPRRDGRANVVRSVTTLSTGTAAQARDQLAELAAGYATPVLVGDDAHPGDTHPRVWVRRRGPQAPTVEHFLAIAPVGPVDKTGPDFTAAWRAGLTGAVQEAIPSL